MIKKPSASELMAQKTAARIAALAADDANENSAVAETNDILPPDCEPAAQIAHTTTAPKNKGGRPKGKREVAGKQTVHLDPARLQALRDLAADRGRSVHSLIIEGIDAIIGKPQKTVWKMD